MEHGTSTSIAQRLAVPGSALFISSAGAIAASESFHICKFVKEMLDRCALWPGKADLNTIIHDDALSPPPLVSSVRPLEPACRVIAFDLLSILRLKDVQKFVVLSPDCVDDYARMINQNDNGRTRLPEVQDALRSSTSVLVFHTAHLRKFVALGAKRATVVSRPALPLEARSEPEYDLLIIDHGNAEEPAAKVVQQALLSAMPSVRVGLQPPHRFIPLKGQVHIHVGDEGTASETIRTIDSHALGRPVIQLAACDETSMAGIVPLVEHMLLHPIVSDDASAAVRHFNQNVEAQLRAALA